jgi:hypothetical protein
MSENWSPSDCHLFPQLKQNFGSHKFKDDREAGNSCDTMAGNKARAFIEKEHKVRPKTG